MLAYIESGKSEGATLAAGGEPHKDVNGKGFFVSPTMFTGVKDNMKIYREEIFGPFVVVSSFKTEDEAIQRANDTTYGLGSAVFTENLTKAHRVAREYLVSHFASSRSTSSHDVPATSMFLTAQ